jgi:hypothetical protein
MPLLPRATVAMTALRLTLLIPVLFALVPLPALAEMPGWWREGAVWAGDGVQADGQRWSVEIALGVDDARISYPSIPCSGTLEVLAATATTITLRETITVGRWACITGGTVGLRVEAGGSLMFDWHDKASGLTATAILAPPVS